MKKNQFPENTMLVFACSRFPGMFCIGRTTTPPKMKENYVLIAEGILVPVSAIKIHEDASNLLKSGKKEEAILLLKKENQRLVTGLPGFEKLGVNPPTVLQRQSQTIAA